MNRRALAAALVCCFWPAAGRAAPSDVCRDGGTAEELLQDSDDPELLKYAVCLEVATGRRDLCNGFSGGPLARKADGLRHEVVGPDGQVRLETTYAVCVTLAPSYRFLALLVGGASQKELMTQLRRGLYGEKVRPEEALRASVDAFRRRSLEGSVLPELASRGFFSHLLGAHACRTVASPGLRRECNRKAATIEALRAGDAARCLADDLMCRTLVAGDGDCRALGARIRERRCGPNRPPPEESRPAAG